MRYLLAIMLCLGLTACAGPRMAEELQGGKASFESGYYKEAFHQLLPLAVKGNAEAQYAVGYMYYYGYGVPEDTESGMFWMSKAADQHYSPAIQALQIIHQHHIETEHWQKRDERLQYAPISVTHQKMSLLETETRPEPAVKIATAQEEKSDLLDMLPTAPASRVTPKVVTSTPTPTARKYALQLYGSYHLASVKELQKQLHLKNTGHIYQTTHNGKDWYVLTFGRFATASEASATQHNLPGTLKKMTPWVRNVNELQLV